MQDQINRLAVRIGLLYVLIASLWILSSDRIVAALFLDSITANRIQTYKGLVFVIVTAWLLFRVLRRYLNRWEKEVEQRRQAEEALGENEVLYRTIFENAVGGFFQSTPDGRFIRVNKALATMCGYTSPEEMVQMVNDIAVNHYLYPQDRDAFKRILEGKGVVENFEHEALRKDGSTFWISVSARAVKDEKDRILYYEGTYEEIDKRKKAELLLADAEAQYRSLFEFSTNAIIIRNREGIITMVNDAVLSLLGAESEDDLVGMAYLDFVHPEDKALSADRVEKIFEFVMGHPEVHEKEPKMIFPREHRMIKLNGDLIHVESTGVAFPHKNELFIQGIFRDITERKRVEEALQRSEAAAKRLSHENMIIAQIGRIISSTLDIDEVYERFAQEVSKLISFDGIAINIVNHEEGTVSVPYILGIAVQGCEKGDVFPLEGSVTGEIMRKRTGGIKQLEGPEGPQKKFSTLSRAYEQGLRSLLVVPLISKDVVIGTIHLRSRTPSAYSPRDVELAERIGFQIAGAIANAQLFEERQKGDLALRESEERYRLLAENASDVIWIRDLNLKCTYVSPSIEKMTGYSIKEAMALTLEESYTPDSIAMNMKVLQEELALENDKKSDPFRIRTLEFEAYRKDGSIIWTESRMTFLRNSTGQITGIQGVSRDITDRKRAEEEKARLEAQILRSQKMEALGLLAGGVAHDLNNVLSGIVSYPDLLLLDLPPDSPLRDPIVTIQKSGQKAASIVQDLLTLARRGVIFSEIINLNDLVSDYLKSPEHEKLISFHPNIRVKTHLEAELPNLEGSPIHLKKSIMNLISNAAESQPEGGEISIFTESRYVDKPIQGYEKIHEGDYAVLRVRDRGIGISPEDLGRIFEPFYTKKVMGRSGTGLGMAVVWGTVQDHKGYIQVNSTLGEGTVFELLFPITREEMRRGKTILSLEPYMGHQESILVVDDIPEQRDISVRMLHRLNYRSTAVSSGEEAVEYLQNNIVDVLLLDMIMDPGIDGLETYKRILKIHPHQKAILASGFSETDRVYETQKLGAGSYIKKPYTLEKLGSAMKKELSRSNPLKNISGRRDVRG